MKDMRHHRRHLQKKVMQEARQYASSLVAAVTPAAQSPELVAAVVDQDKKRKMPAGFVRHVSQRERSH